MNLKKVQCRWHRFPPATFLRVGSYRRQPWAIKSTTPMVLVHVHRFPNKQTNKQNHPRAICPNDTVGAVPVCPPERPRSGVSIPKIHVLCAGNERWMRPCRATRAGTQAPPLPIPTIVFRTSHTNKITIYAQFTPNEINRPCAIRPYQSPSNHAVSHYRVAVILSIAQGWQVQRSLPWVMM